MQHVTCQFPQMLGHDPFQNMSRDPDQELCLPNFARVPVVLAMPRRSLPPAGEESRTRVISAACGLATLASGATVGGGPFCFDHDFGGIHTAKVGLNYRFGGSAYGY